jgi:hypothetical protein
MFLRRKEGKLVYDKIYKEIFLKSFIKEKKKVFQFPDDENVSIWRVRIYQQNYYIIVYLDDIEKILTPEEKKQNIKDYEKRNEAELAHFRFYHGEDATEKRIIANRLFLELLRRYSKEAEQLQKI